MSIAHTGIYLTLCPLTMLHQDPCDIYPQDSWYVHEPGFWPFAVQYFYDGIKGLKSGDNAYEWYVGGWQVDI